MTNEELPSSPAPNALASLGVLRECVTAASNLKGLLHSLKVGPKLLAPVMPDVSSCLAQWRERIPSLAAFVCRELELDEETFEEFEATALAAPGALVRSLELAERGSIRARERLAIERQLTSSLPLMLSALSLLELLVESTHAPGMPLLVQELFASPQSEQSVRPHRSAVVLGLKENPGLVASPRVVLLCLGALAGSYQVESGKSLGIEVCATSQGTTFRLLSCEQREPVVTLPAFEPSPHAALIIRSALRPTLGTLDEENRTLRLPSLSSSGAFD